MGRRKKSSEEILREAENHPTVRKLRELVATGEAELAERERRRQRGDAPRSGE